jgi:subtilisin family serine protease
LLQNASEVGSLSPGGSFVPALRRRCAMVMAFLLVFGLLPLPQPAAVEAAPGPSPVGVPHQVVIAFDAGTSEAARDAIVARRGGRTLERLDSINARLVELPAASLPTTSIASIDGEAGVRYAQPNYSYTIDATPNDPDLPELWGLHNTGQTGGTNDADIDAPEAWDVTTGSQSIVVGVVDTGILYSHPDLAANMWTAPAGWNVKGCGAGTRGYRSDPGGTSCNPIDEHGHGTHVAGTIGATGNNGQGVVGVNWSVKLMALRFFDANGSGNTAGAVQVIDYAVKAKQAGVNIRVLNNSWTGGSHDQALLDQINAANNAGILFVAAAGNGGSDWIGDNNGTTPIFPANYGAAPYNRPNVIAVAATDHNENLATFSNFGSTTVHLGAPGVDVFSTLTGNGYGWMSGTSMASPHVAGAAALVLSVPAFANLSVTDLRDRLLNCGEARASLSGKTITGKRLNVARAINGTGGCAPAPTPNPAPDIATIAPTSTAAGGAQFALTVNGSNFVPGSVVRWNGADRPTTYVSATQLTATIAASLIASAGSASVTVFNPAPGGGTSSAAQFTISQASQTITFNALGNKTYGDPNFTVSATASSGLVVSFAAGGNCTVSGTTVALTGAGSCTITASQAGNGTYGPAPSVSRTFSIAKGNPTITWATPVAITYGTALGATQLNATAGVEGSFAYSPVSGTVLPAGTQTLSVTFTPIDTANYNVVTASRQIVVSKATPVITWANPAAITYGTPLGANQLNATASVEGTYAYSPVAGTILGAGPRSLSVTFTPTDAANYGTATKSVSLTVNKASLTVTVQAASKTYGSANPAFSVAYSGFVNGDDAGDLGGALSFATSATNSSTVGGYPVSASGLSSANYTIGYVAGTLTVNPAPLTVTADNKGRAYGAANPALTASYSGFVLGQSTSALSGALACATTATQSSPAGLYPITCSGLNATNYAITYVAGTLTVGQATQTISFAMPPNKTYGDAAITLSATATSGLAVAFSVPAGGPCALSGTTLSITGVGTCTVTASQPGNVNYAAAPDVVRSFTIGKGTPTIAWGAPTAITYGTPLGATQLNATASVEGSFAYAPGSGTILPVGAHAITVTFTPADSARYNGATATVSLTVTRAALTVTAQGASKSYGAANPAFAVAYSGFVNGDDPGDLTGSLSYATGATASSVPGTYPVTPSGLSATNYAISFVAGTLTVNPAPLMIAAGSASRAFGAANPTFTASNTGFVLGQSVSALGGTLACATTATASSLPGPYPITCAGLTSTNYAITYVAGTLTVTAAPTTVAVPTVSVTLGTAETTLVANLASTVPVNGGTVLFTVTQGQATIGTATSGPVVNGVASVSFGLSGLGAGAYTISASYSGAGGFAAGSGSGTISIGQASQTISFAALTDKTYGDPAFALSATATSGLPVTFSVPGRGPCTLSGATLTIVGTGTCTVTASQAGNADFAPATNVVRSFAIGKGTVAVNWNAPAAITYGTALGAAQLNASASIAGSFAYSPAAGTILGAGTHQLGVSFTPVDSANYSAASASVGLTVNPAALTITAEAKSRTYGAANPTFTVGYDGFVLGQGSGALTGTLSCATTASVSSLPGDYPITCSGLASTNYAISYVAGTLTVLQAPTTLDLFGASAALGEPSVALTATVSAAVAVHGGTVLFTIKQGQMVVGTATSGPVAGGVAIATLDLTGVGAGSYEVIGSYSGTATLAQSTDTGTLTVGKATPVVSWGNPAAIGYGTPLAATQLDATANVAGSFAYSPAAGTILGAGQHLLNVTFTPGDSANYAPTTATVTLVVDPAPLTVTTNGATKVYGAPLPAFGANFAGFVNGDDAGDLGGTLSFATTATQASPTGSYPVTPGGLTATNYALAFVAGTLTVEKAPQTITISPDPLPDRTLGDSPVAVSAMATSGLTVVFAVGPADPCAIGNGTIALVAVGTCTVTASQGGDANYLPATSVVRSFRIASAPVSPSPSPSSSPGTQYTLGLAQANGGSATANPGPGQHPAGTVVTLIATPDAGQLFTGWWVNGALRSYANPAQLILSGDRTVAPSFAAQPTFGDVPQSSAGYEAITQLAARGVIRGYGTAGCAALGVPAPCFGPDDQVTRAQMAALIARAMGWDGEDHGNPFTDSGGIDPSLWRNVGTLAHYGVAFGYGNGTFGPNDKVTYAQTISFISRALVVKGYWQPRTAPPDPVPYGGILSGTGHQNDVATYLYYTASFGGVPDHPIGGGFADWNRPSSRGWFSRTLWAALRSEFAVAQLP